MAKISVIVPVYKAEPFLKKCIESIVNQTFSDIEIICVNDGSPDNSAQILNEYAQKDCRIKIIFQENLGVSAARNAALAVATGEYIGFVDSDDWINADFYEKLYNTAKKYDADIAVCGIQKVKGNKKKPFLKIKKEKFTVDKDKKFEIGNIPQKNYVWNKIYKLERLKEYNIQFEEGMYYEDILFSAQAFLYARSVVTVPNINYNYVVNPDSIVNVKSTLKEEHFRDNYNRAIKFLEENNVNSTVYKNIEKFKVFGITVFKIMAYKYRKDYLFFNCIRFTHERY